MVWPGLLEVVCGVEKRLALEAGAFYSYSAFKVEIFNVRTCRQQDLGFWVNNTLHHGQVLFKLLLLAILKDSLGFLHYFFNSTTPKNVPYNSWSNCSHGVVHNEPICQSGRIRLKYYSQSSYQSWTESFRDNSLFHWINISQLFRISQLLSLHSYPVLKKWMNKSLVQFANATLKIWLVTHLHCWWDEGW